jgi:hypothetical protein
MIAFLVRTSNGGLANAGVGLSAWEYDNEKDELDERYIDTEAWMVTGSHPGRCEHPVMRVDNATRRQV